MGGKKKGGQQQSFAFNFSEVKAPEAKQGGNVSEDKATDLVPALLPMVQKKLNTLVGTSSGYLETLPKSVQNRVRALTKLQKQKEEIDDEYKKEREALEAKYRDKWVPLYTKRSAIVTGAEDPEWIEPEKKEGETKEEKKDENKNEKDDVKGIPEFWLQVLMHHDEFRELINEEGDEAALKHLIDIRIKTVTDEKHSFTLEFEFTQNPYFENTVLSKTYHLFEHPAYGEVMFDRVDVTDIKWKSGKKLTVKLVTKSQGGGRGGRRGGKRGGGAPPKTVTVEEPIQSFFNFFTPDGMLFVPPEDDEPMEEEELEGMLEFDYELGCALKDVLIPNALKWFTGEAAVIDDDEDGEEGDEEDGEEGAEEDDEEGEDDDAPPKDSSAPAQSGDKPECKQQ